MAGIEEQVHGKFKLFAGAVDANGGLGALPDAVSTFVSERKLAPKSIGVEYLESSNHVVVTLGYRDDEAPYGVKLVTEALGKTGELTSGTDFSKLEAAMAAASAKHPGIICHELFITEDREFHLVFMVRT